MSVEINSEYADVGIVGAGLSGILTALRLAHSFPQKKIVLLEMGKKIGGRGRLVRFSGELSGGGMSLVTGELVDFIQRTLQPVMDTSNVCDGSVLPVKKASVVQQQKLKVCSWNDYFSEAGLKSFCGRDIARLWIEFEAKICQIPVEQRDAPLSKFWSESKKHPALRPLEQWLHPLGFSDDLLTWAVRCLLERLDYMRSIHGRLLWERFESVLNDCEGVLDNLLIRRESQVLSAQRNPDSGWSLRGQGFELNCGYLVSAVHPRLLTDWIDVSELPRPIVQQSIKVPPTSMVMITQTMPELIGLWESETPNFTDQTWVLAENTTFQPQEDGLGCLKTWVDFEQSLEAPSVVKAIRRLRRAREKLSKSLDLGSPVTSQEHIALIPVAFSGGSSPAVSRLNQYLGLEQAVHGKGLSFCSDALGVGLSSDKNIVASVVRVCDKVGQHLNKSL